MTLERIFGIISVDFTFRGNFMKRIVASLLLVILALTVLASCEEKIDADFINMDADKVERIHFTQNPDAAVDAASFVAAYNDAEFVKGCKSSYGTKTTNVVVVSLGDDVFTLYPEKKDRFVVDTSLSDANYIIKSKDLYTIYRKAIGELPPDAVFVKLNEDEESKVTSVLYPDAAIDAGAFVKAYNSAKFIEGTHEKAESKYKDVIVVTSESTALVVYFVGEDRFIVSTELSSADYIIESAELAKLYKAISK